MREQKVVARRQCEKPQHKLGIWWKTTDLVPGFWKTGPGPISGIGTFAECQREGKGGREEGGEGEREKRKGEEKGRRGRGEGGNRRKGRKERGSGETGGSREGGEGRRVASDRGWDREEKLRQLRENPKANEHIRIQEPGPILHHREEESRRTGREESAQGQNPAHCLFQDSPRSRL